MESVKEARSRDVLHSVRPFTAFTETGVTWPDGSESELDAVIWCTDFKANLTHLKPLGLTVEGRIVTKGTRATVLSRLWLVGYGRWTGFASATIFGVQKSARATAQEIQHSLGGID
ncbi:FAD-dependent pyridine nucleotide-disulphide oxidoreductase [Rhodobacteraceae bacterium KLH11]|nr:FAD-dependent pyridine nucleotide-disulphide oxidoreductase [Rhodobacteraceae bacterium KLH11]